MKNFILTLVLVASTFSYGMSQTQMATELAKIAKTGDFEFLTVTKSGTKPDLIGSFDNYAKNSTNPAITSNTKQIENALTEIDSVYLKSTTYDTIQTALQPQNSMVLPLSYLNGQTALIFSALKYTTLFNSLTLDDIGRAEKVAQHEGFPFLGRVAKYFADNQYIGVCVTYASKNFREEFAISNDDVQIIVVDAKTAKQFANLEISETEFAQKCNVYLLDGQESDTYLRKVLLKI